MPLQLELEYSIRAKFFQINDIHTELQARAQRYVKRKGNRIGHHHVRLDLIDSRLVVRKRDPLQNKYTLLCFCLKQPRRL